MSTDRRAQVILLNHKKRYTKVDVVVTIFVAVRIGDTDEDEFSFFTCTDLKGCFSDRLSCLWDVSEDDT